MAVRERHNVKVRACEISHTRYFKSAIDFLYIAMKGLAMRALLLGLLIIAGTTATAATILHSAGASHRPAVKQIAVSNFEYRFYERFCRAQYNNPRDRNACVMQATGVPLYVPNSERDDR
jgi:hypothetical protein